MRDVFVLSDNIVSPLGASTGGNFRSMREGKSGISLHERHDMSAMPFYASLFGNGSFGEEGLDLPTKFERMAATSITGAFENSGLRRSDPRLIFILASTKGNIGLLETGVSDPAQFSLAESGERIARHCGFKVPPLVLSHACISGLQAMIVAMRLLRSGVYDHAVVTGADVITRFILSGFQSFQAVSPEPCQPFDADRKGVTLGEAAGTVVLSIQKPDGHSVIRLAGGAVSNDANHISGPSRTGEELYLAIRKALAAAGSGSVDFVSAHGTATLYNDDMEARALNLAGLQRVPVNSLKGYYGHTLGAAGLIESIISMQSLRENLILPTLGYKRPGTVLPVNVLETARSGEVRRCLKTASGFGGCNAVVVLEKI